MPPGIISMVCWLFSVQIWAHRTVWLSSKWPKRETCPDSRYFHCASVVPPPGCAGDWRAFVRAQPVECARRTLVPLPVRHPRCGLFGLFTSCCWQIGDLKSGAFVCYCPRDHGSWNQFQMDHTSTSVQTRRWSSLQTTSSTASLTSSMINWPAAMPRTTAVRWLLR